MTNGLQRVLVDMLHVVADGMPCRTEAALLTVGVVVDDVNTGDAGFLVDGDMVVSNTASRIVDEQASVACGTSGLPYLLNDTTGILHGERFAVELGTLSANHVQEDTILITLGS